MSPMAVHFEAEPCGGGDVESKFDIRATSQKDRSTKLLSRKSIECDYFSLAYNHRDSEQQPSRTSTKAFNSDGGSFSSSLDFCPFSIGQGSHLPRLPTAGLPLLTISSNSHHNSAQIDLRSANDPNVCRFDCARFAQNHSD